MNTETKTTIRFYTLNPLIIYGGVEKVLANIVNNDRIRKHCNIEIVTFQTKNEINKPIVKWLQTDAIRRYPLPSRKWRSIRSFIRYRLCLSPLGVWKSLKYDFEKNGWPKYAIVLDSADLIPEIKKTIDGNHSETKLYNWDHGLFPLLFSKQYSIKRQISAQFQISLLGKYLNKCDGHLVLSTEAVELVRTIAPLAEIHLLANPVRSYTGPLIQKPKRTIFLFIGRLDDQSKNFTFMLRGLAFLKESDWSLIVVGDGPDSESLKKKAIDLGIGHRITWLGFQNEPFDSIKEASFLLLCSRSEGFSLVVVEAIQRGIPVISSDCAGPREIIIPGENGFLFPVDNMDEYIYLLRSAIEGKLALPSTSEIAASSKRFEMAFEKEFLSIFVAKGE